MDPNTDGASPENLPDTENSDGIRRGPAEVMGSGLEGVRVDEIATIEEGEFLPLFSGCPSTHQCLRSIDDEDAQLTPDYDADSRESAEAIQYDSEDGQCTASTSESRPVG